MKISKHLVRVASFTTLAVFMGACSHTKIPVQVSSVTTDGVAHNQAQLDVNRADNQLNNQRMMFGNINPMYWRMFSRMGGNRLFFLVLNGKDCKNCGAQRMQLHTWLSTGANINLAHMSQTYYASYVKRQLNVDKAGVVVVYRNGKEVARTTSTGVELASWTRKTLKENGYDLSRFPSDPKWPVNDKDCFNCGDCDEPTKPTKPTKPTNPGGGIIPI